MAIAPEDMKRYGWFLFGVMGVVFFWAGVWDGVGYLPYIASPWLSILIGAIMLASSKKLFGEADPAKAAERKAQQVLHQVHRHPLRHEFHVKYHDKIRQQDMLLSAAKIHRLEKGFLVMLESGRELFVPVHRIREVLHKGKVIHKL